MIWRVSKYWIHNLRCRTMAGIYFR